MFPPIFCPHCGIRLSPPPPSAIHSRDDSGPDKERSPAPAHEGTSPGDSALSSGIHDDLEHHDPITSASLASSDDELKLGSSDRGPSAALLGIDLERSARSGHAGPHRRDRKTNPTPASQSEPRTSSSQSGSTDDQLIAHRSAWPVALLVSYASAATLACGWLWWTGHRDAPRGPAPVWAAGRAAEEANAPSSIADSGRRAGASSSVSPSEPIPEDRLLPIGESLRIDALEIVPLKVSIGPVKLRRTRVDGRTEWQDGGSGAFRLHLRLKNASDDVIFAPLDESFVRDPDRQLPETFIEGESGARVYGYRLPVSSEWEIDGQVFTDLRPGEVVETVVLSDSESIDLLEGPLTWRLRLRTAPETTAVVGVSFDRSEVERSR